ncbi:MAG: potassium transporter TrkG [Brumimicrobium sp.]|nr:potassium transporter TrkG [Brumimicrobium sp.]
MPTVFKTFYRIAFWISLLGVLAFIGDFGFVQRTTTQLILNKFYFVVLIVGALTTILRYIQKKKIFKKTVFAFDLLTVLFSIFIFLIHLFKVKPDFLPELFYNAIWVKLAVILTFIREFSEVRLNYKRTTLNPAQLFIASFLSIITLGALLLMLPNATHDGISLVDALFTSTSAVCVTGLIVVDTGSYFTEFGQIVIMLLFQIGGLGILTFTSYFSYFFKGGSSYENHLALRDMISSQKLGEVFSTLRYIILITFIIELISGIVIYFSLDPGQFESNYDQIFFAVFHAISAFCNAGFSLLTNSIYEDGFKFNYFLQLAVAFTFIIGGLGFPIVANILKYLKYKILNLIRLGKKQIIKPWVLNINSRITLITTFSITIVAFVLFFVLEYNNTLEEHGFWGKVVTAFFGAATPRTAGFNSVDTAALGFSTLMIVFLLMWIGASPSSTGGGIKTSTFAVATLNIFSQAKGKSRIEVFRRQIADISVRRAFAVISLSLIAIGVGVMLIAVFDEDKSLMSIAFECFSAYGTVGLSLGITADLSVAGKIVIMVMMFVGRVSMLTVLIAVFRRVQHKNYSYPTEEIMIN